jgi:putative addiction module antidote
MATKLKLRKVGNSLGLIVPKELTDALRVREGDSLYVVTDRAGELRLTPFDPGFDKAMLAFERTRRKYRNALRELAK